MNVVLIVFGSGIIIGYFLRKYKKALTINDHLVNVAIYLLLLLLGIAVGSNDQILQNFEVIGFNALLVSVFSIAGSVLMAWIVYKFFFKSR